MNILVTGGCGFMGSHFIKCIKQHDVVCVDKLTYAGNLANLEDVVGIEIVQRDIVDLDKLFFRRYKPEVVVNFSAETHVDRSIRNPKAFLETDVMGLFNLVYQSMKAGVKKFIQISTDEVYGPIEESKLKYAGSEPSYFPGTEAKIYDLRLSEADETSPLNPTSPYSASKASGDLLLQAYHKTYNFPVVMVRPCNNYGPNQYPEKLIPMAITRLLQGEKVLLHGEGEEVREWIYVEDCVKAIEKVMDKGQVGEVYNIGSGIRRSNKDVIVQIIGQVFNKGILFAGDDIEKIPNRPGNDQRYAINSSKLVEKLLGAEGSHYYIHEFEEGLQKTIKWYVDNKGWWSDVVLDDNIYKDNEEYLR